MGRTIGTPSYLKYNEETGAFFIAKKGVSLERPGFVLIVEDQPQIKLNAFTDLARLLNADLEQDGEPFYSANDLMDVWPIFDFAYEAGKFSAEQPLKQVTEN